MRDLKTITKESFAPYGTVIKFPEDFTGNFLILETEQEQPWRLAVFRYDNHEIEVLEHHPTSKESFEPLSGITVLLVARNGTPENWEAFLLEQPVSLEKGIWHQVLALTEEASVKITENLDVESVFYKMEVPVKVAVTEI